jgi:hypothetical protein
MSTIHTIGVINFKSEKTDKRTGVVEVCLDTDGSVHMRVNRNGEEVVITLRPSAANQVSDLLHRAAQKSIGTDDAPVGERTTTLDMWMHRALRLEDIEQRLMRLACAIHGDAGGDQILTEGQIAKIIGCDIVEVRRLCDEAPNRAEDR